MNFTEDQLKAITESGQNIIVSAGAGSGKTAVLSERVIEKLKKGINIDELLILTFTEAASKEMLDRITKKIKDAKMNDQLDRIDSSYITTFDSFALSIVKKYSHVLNINRNVKIVDKSIMTIKKSQELDKIFDELYKEKNPLFIKFITDFCIKDDQKVKDELLNVLDEIDKIYDFDFDNYIENNYKEETINQNTLKYINYIFEKIENIKYLKEEMKYYADSDFQNKMDNEISKYDLCKTYDDLKNISIDIPKCPNKSSEELKALRKKIKESKDKIDELLDYDNEESIKKQIQDTKNYAIIIIEILKKLTDRLNKYKYDNDTYEFVDIAKMVIKLVKENADIKNELKNKFKEIMIDEYQDTNDLQDLFIKEIENNNIYMVGDIKQSIYRFRNANPNLFKEKYENYSNNNGGIKIDLNKNFRSRKEPIAAINEIFNSIMDIKIGGADYETSHQMIFGNEIYNTNEKENSLLEIYNYEKNDFKKEEIEAFIIATDIKEKIKNNYQIYDKDKKCMRSLKYDDIAILMDKGTNFDLYKQIFEYLNIPLSIYKEKTITDSDDIVILKNIIALLINDEKKFKHAFMSVERSYLLNTKDEYIFKYIKNEKYDEAESIKKTKNINITTLKKTVEDIIKEFGFYEKIITIGNINDHIATIEYVINKTEELEQIGYTIYDFYDYLNSIIDSEIKVEAKVEKEKNGVKILTIHKSKGLEYYVCYFPGLYAKFNKSDLNANILFDKEFGIILPTISESIRPTIYKTLMKDKYIKEEISERIRLFYVALTRVREKMIIVCPLEEKDTFSKVPLYIRYNYNSFLDMLNSIKLDKYIKNIDLEKLNISSDYNNAKKKELNINKTNEKLEVKELDLEKEYVEDKTLSKKQNKLLNKKEYENILYGTKIHSIFENIDFKDPNYDGLSNFEKEKVMKFINNTIFNNVVNIYKEHAFKYKKENETYNGVIDLILEYDNYYAIVDYKLKNIDDEEYSKQLNGYKEYIENITGKKCEIYLYSIMDSMLKKM